MTIQQTAIIASALASAIVNPANLYAAINTVMPAIDKRNDTPILSTVSITGHGDHLEVVATDLDIQIKALILGAVDSRFSMAIPADTLKKLTANKKINTMNLSHDIDETESAKISFGNSEYNLKTRANSDFPLLPEISHNESYSFDLCGKWLNKAIKKVMGAISTEETRYYLNGIYMHTSNGKLIFVATDGHRLYKEEIEAPLMIENMPGVIIPTKTIKILHKLTNAKLMPETVQLKVSKSKVQFSFDNIEIRSKVIDGTFPDYTRVIPENNNTVARMDKKQFFESLADVVAITEKGRAVKLTLESGICTLSTDNPESGNATSLLECNFEGEAMEIGFNADYLKLMKVNIEGDYITFNLQDSGSPTIITGDDVEWLAILMPMRV